MTLGDGGHLVGAVRSHVELHDCVPRGQLIPHGSVLLARQDLLFRVIHRMKAESDQPALPHPVAHLVRVCRVLWIDQPVSDEAIGEAGDRIGDVAVVPRRPARLHQNGPINPAVVHFRQQFVRRARLVREAFPVGRRGADRVARGIDLPYVYVGVYNHLSLAHSPSVRLPTAIFPSTTGC